MANANDNASSASHANPIHPGLSLVHADEKPVKQARFYLTTYVERAIKSASKHSDSADCYGAGIELGHALADVIHRSILEEGRGLKNSDYHHLLSDAALRISGLGLGGRNVPSEKETDARRGIMVGLMCQITELAAKSKNHLRWPEFSVDEKMGHARKRASAIVRKMERDRKVAA
jgi:hypothetical protein